jgi:hypothetical protein
MTHMRSTVVRVIVALVAIPAAVLVGCAPNPTAPPGQNSQDDSAPVPADPGAGDLEDGEAWMVKGANDYLDGSSPVCADEDTLTNPNSEFGGVYLEEGPGMPDSWKPGDEYEANGNGISLYFEIGKYDSQRFDGDISTGRGTSWETNGTFTFERDADGVISGGSGTGKTTVIHDNGDVEHLTDSMTFAVTVVDAPRWCSIPVE